MRETIIRDDLTHEIITEDELVKVEYAFGEQVGEFEGRQPSVDALMALFHDHNPAKLAALLAPKAASTPKPATKRARKPGMGESARTFAWAETPEGQATVTRLGIEYKKHGQAPKALRDAWREAKGKAA